MTKSSNNEIKIYSHFESNLIQKTRNWNVFLSSRRKSNFPLSPLELFAVTFSPDNKAGDPAVVIPPENPFLHSITENEPLFIFFPPSFVKNMISPVGREEAKDEGKKMDWSFVKINIFLFFLPSIFVPFQFQK